MIYVKDNYTLENEQTVILLEAYPETLFTNTSDEEAVLEYSHNGTNWDTLLTLAPNQKQSIAVTSRYVRQITKTTVEAKGVGSHITPLVLASNPLQSGTDFSDYITKPQLDSAIAKVNDKTALLATQEQLQTATQSQTRALTTETQQRHSQIDTINQTITRNKQAQDELINQKANQTALTALEAKVTANTTKNQSQDTEIAKKANQASLTAETTARNQAIETLKGTITANKQTQDSTINQLRADLNTKASQSDLATETSNRTSAIAGLNQKVATHKQQLDRQIQSLEQSKADKNTVNQQLSTKANQSQIDGINTAMEQKASKLNQVTAGNGLTGGGTLANSFQIALGLPSTISRSTTNSVTSTSHTHAIETATTTRAGIVQLNDNLTSTSTEQALTARQGKSLKEQLDRLSNTVDTNNTGMSVMVNTKVDKITSITTGEGLTGGGTLSENLVIALGTPSTITQSSTNTTTANSHSHAIDTATTTQAGIVTLSHETNGTNKTKAVSEFALGEVRRLVNNLNSTITSHTPNLTTLAWNSITDKPTTLAGYGIIDAISRNTDTEITSLLTINKSDSYIQGKTNNTRKWYLGKGSSFSDDIQLHNFTHSTQLNLTNNKIVASHDLYVNDSKVITANDTTVFVTPDALNQGLAAKAAINHQHTIAEISELQNILNSKLNSNASAISAQKLTTPRRINGIVFDGTQDITLPTTTNVSWSAISNKPANFTPSAHSHVIADITNLQRELDSKASSNHSHAWNSITDKPTTLTGYGIGNAMQTDTDSETTGLISINRADSYIQGKQGSIRRWYVGSGSSSNHNVQLSNSTHNTQLELTNDRVTSNKALYVGTRRVLLEGDEITSTTAQPTNTAVRVTNHPATALTNNASLETTTFVYSNGRIVHRFIYKNLRQPAFNSITSGGTHVRTLTINLPTAMPRHITQVNAYFYRPEFTDASFPLIISHKANDISNSSINLQISGTARGVSFSGILDLVIIVEGY
uniref:tail fiber protein n=1 Tax=Moraxella catarrhalis TaxID=480 RepID=UPI001883A3F5|nr:tail fiber protein [Moraxella catarrhalis]